MYISNNPYANFKFELIDTLSRINSKEFDYSKNYSYYSKIFRKAVKDRCNDLNEIGIDKLKASIAEVRPDLRLNIYSKLFNMEDFCAILYHIYLDDMFSIAMWKRIILWQT